MTTDDRERRQDLGLHTAPADGVLPVKPIRTLDELRAHYGPSWGLETGKQKAPSAPIDREAVWEHYRHFDLGFKPKGQA